MLSATVTPVEEIGHALTERYGPLLRHDQVAKVLDVSPESLGNTLRRSREPNVMYLKKKKLRFGRRVRYSAIAVAEALVLDHDELTRRMSVADRGSEHEQ
ncbi:MAG: hypothetical protein WD078_00965 [Woeseia sp.]